MRIARTCSGWREAAYGERLPCEICCAAWWLAIAMPCYPAHAIHTDLPSQAASQTSATSHTAAPTLTQVLAARRLQQADGRISGRRRLQPLLLLVLNLLGPLLKLVCRWVAKGMGWG